MATPELQHLAHLLPVQRQPATPEADQWRFAFDQIGPFGFVQRFLAQRQVVAVCNQILQIHRVAAIGAGGGCAAGLQANLGAPTPLRCPPGRDQHGKAGVLKDPGILLKEGESLFQGEVYSRRLGLIQPDPEGAINTGGLAQGQQQILVKAGPTERGKSSPRRIFMRPVLGQRNLQRGILARRHQHVQPPGVRLVLRFPQLKQQAEAGFRAAPGQLPSPALPVLINGQSGVGLPGMAGLEFLTGGLDQRVTGAALDFHRSSAMRDHAMNQHLGAMLQQADLLVLASADDGAAIRHVQGGFPDQLLILVGDNLPAGMQFIPGAGGFPVDQRGNVAVAQDDRLEGLGEVMPEQQIAARSGVGSMTEGEKAQFTQLGNGPDLSIGIHFPGMQRRRRQIVIHPMLELRHRQGKTVERRQGDRLWGKIEPPLVGRYRQAQRVLKKSDQLRLGEMARVPVLSGPVVHRLLFHPQPQIAQLNEGIGGLGDP